jgi:hypothetical protein
MKIALRRSLLPLAVFLLISRPVSAADDAENLSKRVPNQSYYVGETSAWLDRGEISWGIPLWACDPAGLAIIKVLRGSGPAPYAIKITPIGNNPIYAYDRVGRLQSIHLLAASLEDAIKMRHALISEIDAMQRRIEKRQGNAAGYLKRINQSKKH